MKRGFTKIEREQVLDVIAALSFANHFTCEAFRDLGSRRLRQRWAWFWALPAESAWGFEIGVNSWQARLLMLAFFLELGPEL